MKRASKARTIAVMVGLILPSVAVLTLGQVATGSISGLAKDSQSAVIAGAKVTLQDTKSKNTLSTITNTDGRFKFTDLPLGIYQLRVEHVEFKAVTRERVTVVGSRNTEIDFRLETFQACDNVSPEASELTNLDKAEIVRLVLVEALVEKKIPDYQMLTETKSVVLSTLNIERGWVPRLSNYDFRLMSPAEIRKRADDEGDFLYLSFAEFKAKGSCVAVTLLNSWAVGRKSGMGYLSGGGFRYEYRKRSGKWWESG